MTKFGSIHKFMVFIARASSKKPRRNSLEPWLFTYMKYRWRWGDTNLDYNTQQAHNHNTMRCRRRYDVTTFHRRCLNVLHRLGRFAGYVIRPRGYKNIVQPQTQNKAQWLAACGHVSASSQSLRFILSLRINSSFVTSRSGAFIRDICMNCAYAIIIKILCVGPDRLLLQLCAMEKHNWAHVIGMKVTLSTLTVTSSSAVVEPVWDQKFVHIVTKATTAHLMATAEVCFSKWLHSIVTQLTWGANPVYVDVLIIMILFH